MSKTEEQANKIGKMMNEEKPKKLPLMNIFLGRTF
jgi:hypothetical protein